MKGRSIRFRLTVGYFAVLAVTFLLFGVGAFMAVRRAIQASVDHELRDRLGGVRAFMQQTMPGSLLEEAQHEFREHSAGGDLIQVGDATGAWIYQSDSIRKYKLPAPRPEQLTQLSRCETVVIQGSPLRVLTATVQVERRPYTVQMAVPLGEFYEVLEEFGTILWYSLPAVLILASLAGYWMSRRALAPVDEITNTARSISAQNLSRRLAVPATGDELQRLSETLNATFERLEEAFNRITQFTADASHELRTPVAFMRTTAELALRKPRSEAEYQEALGQLLSELERISRLIEDLMTLARADSGAESLRLAPMNLTESLREACIQGKTLAAAKQVEFDFRIPETPVRLEGDFQALRRVFLILIDNAVKYTAPGGRIVVSVDTAGGYASVEVCDSGIGISDDDLPHIFERFYRADKARSREMGGAGLGLAIAQWIIQAHRGAIEAGSTPGHGSTFRVRLPMHWTSEPRA
jgi:heavy metal sensor kinase